MALFLHERLSAPRKTLMEVGDGTLNLRLDWGEPRVCFCSHLDTVPPYLPPVLDGDCIRGRGACDAKGQIFSMYTACRELERQGRTGFGLLLLAGEETGSFGAKAYTRDAPGGDLVIVGEPTDNCLATASKGTQAFEVTLTGKACHSGYPQDGISAVDLFVDWVEALRRIPFAVDPEMGETTWNIGRLTSDNPQNILSPRLSFHLYFRTTAASHAQVARVMAGLASERVSVQPLGGDTPLHYTRFDGIPTCTVAFGSDAPRLEKFREKALCGPGSILVAHTDAESVRTGDLIRAAGQYVDMFRQYTDKRTSDRQES